MNLYDFVEAVADKQLPSLTRTGRLFLGRTLTARKVNGKIVISNTPYMEEKENE